jgi:hypothetical protein
MTYIEDNTVRLGNGTWTNKEQTPSPLSFTAHDVPFGTGGYDDVQVGENGVTKYLKDGKGHRENGFAIEYARGGGYYMLGGEFVHEPDDGELGLELRSVTDGIQRWAAEADGHSIEAVRHPDYTVEFFRDRVLSRTGEPAVTRADGSEEWWVDGVPFPGVIPSPGAGSGTDGRYTTTVGSKYVNGIPATDIATQLREDIKIAQAAGVIPVTATVRVTAPNGTVRIEVRGMADADVYVYDDGDRRRYSPKTRRMIDRIQKIGDAYGRSTTDYMGDYSKYSPYVFVELEDEFSANWRVTEAAKAKAKRAAKATAR